MAKELKLIEAAAYQDAFDAFEAGAGTLNNAIEVDAVVRGVTAYFQRVGGIASAMLAQRAAVDAFMASLTQTQQKKVTDILYGKDGEPPRITAEE